MKGTVLLIEDNEQNRYLTTFLLEASGYEVIFAANGLDGLEAARHQTPTLVLVDIQLPVMNGYEVVRALRGLDTFRQVPIIAVTSYAMAGDREKALAAGCDGYIEKPIDPDTFVAEIESFVQNRSSAGLS